MKAFNECDRLRTDTDPHQNQDVNQLRSIINICKFTYMEGFTVPDAAILQCLTGVEGEIAKRPRIPTFVFEYEGSVPFSCTGRTTQGFKPLIKWNLITGDGLLNLVWQLHATGGKIGSYKGITLFPG